MFPVSHGSAEALIRGRCEKYINIFWLPTFYVTFCKTVLKPDNACSQCN